MTPYDILRKEHAVLQRKYDDLAEAYAALKAEPTDNDLQRRLRDGFFLAPSASWLLAALYEAGSRALPRWHIEQHMPGHDTQAERGLKIVDIRICQIRKKIGFDAVEVVRGEGYRLTPYGREVVDTRLNGGPLPRLIEREAKVTVRSMLALVAASPGAYSSQLAGPAGVSVSYASSTLCRLRRDLGLVRSEVETKKAVGRQLVRWWPTEAGIAYLDLKTAEAA